MTKGMNSSKYIPHLQGIRGLAILMVVLAHAKFFGFEGGFIGVDIFFVLSGYLITSILLKEIGSHGRINLARFYARRFRRLFPALVFMVAIASVAVAVLMTPAQQIQQQGAAISSVAWVSNIYFAFQSKSYFSSAQENNVFLHTWSLGVEEQFYLLWPIFLLFAVGGYSSTGVSLRSERLKRVLSLTVFIGFAFSFAITFLKPDWGFYLPISRIWQFAFGGLIAVMVGNAVSGGNENRGWLLKYAGLTSSLGWLGLVGMLSAVFILDRDRLYPGAWAILPTISTGVLLLSLGMQSNGLIAQLLGCKPLKLLGDISYSWYLWHWPVLLIGWSVIPSGGLEYTVLLLLIGFGISVFSYYVIENPIRYGSRLGERATIGLALGSMALLVGCGTVWQERAVEWQRSGSQLHYARYEADFPKIYPMGCDEWYHSPNVKVCGFGDGNAEKTAVLFGDSIAGQWFPAVESIFAKDGWRLLVITKSACPMVDKSYFYPRIRRDYKECEIWRERALAYLKDVRPELVLVASNRSYPFTEDEWAVDGGRVIQSISEFAQQVVVIKPTPSLGFSGPNCLARNAWVPEFVSRECARPLGAGVSSAPAYRGLDRSIIGIDNAVTIDLIHSVCPDNLCEAMQNDVVVFRDDKHLSASFVSSLEMEIRDKLSEVGVDEI